MVTIRSIWMWFAGFLIAIAVEVAIAIGIGIAIVSVLW